MSKTVIEQVRLYRGAVVIDFYPNSHRYKLDGENLISVTAATGKIDKPALVGWAVGLARDFMIDLIERGIPITREHITEACLRHEAEKEKAAGYGSQVHEFAQQFARAKLGLCEMPTISDEWPEPVLNGVHAFLNWITDHSVKFVSAERLVFSRAHRFVGKCDAVAIVDGKLSTVDYKTSNGIYEEHYYQVAGYDIAISEEDGCVFEQHLIIKFGKDTGEFEAKVVAGEDISLNRLAFLNCLNLKQREKAFRKAA